MSNILVNTQDSQRILADSTTSVDVHLTDISHSLQVILPSKHIIIIEPDGLITVFDSTDTQLKSINLLP